MGFDPGHSRRPDGWLETSRRLGKNALRGKVEQYLIERPEEEFGPHTSSQLLGHSSGAITNVLIKLVKAGLACQTLSRLRRSPPAQPQRPDTCAAWSPPSRIPGDGGANVAHVPPRVRGSSGGNTKRTVAAVLLERVRHTRTWRFRPLRAVGDTWWRPRSASGSNQQECPVHPGKISTSPSVRLCIAAACSRSTARVGAIGSWVCA